MEILELKSTITTMVISKAQQQIWLSEERISKLKDKSVNIIQSEQKEKKNEDKWTEP